KPDQISGNTGDSAQFLSQTGWAIPSGGGGGGGGSSSPLESHAASSSPEIVFNGFVGAFTRYQLVISGLRPANDSGVLRMEVSTDGGSTWSAANYQWQARGQDDGGGVGGRQNASDSSFVLQENGLGIRTASGTASYAAVIELFSLNQSTLYMEYLGRAFCSESGADHRARQWNIAGSWRTAGSVNALRFKIDNGNIASGVFSIYGF